MLKLLPICTCVPKSSEYGCQPTDRTPTPREISQITGKPYGSTNQSINCEAFTSINTCGAGLYAPFCEWAPLV